MKLTPRQNAVLAYVRDFIAVKGYSPSVRDVAVWLGVTPRGALLHLHALEQKGMIRREPGVARSIQIIPIVHT